MKFIVCVKIIQAKLLFSDSNNKFVINPFDLYTLGKLQELRKNIKVHITALIMGVLDKRIIAELKVLGCDEVIFLYDSEFAGADTLATSYVLAKAVKKIKEYDFVACGDHAIDGETGHVGYFLAERLGIPSVANVTDIQWLDEDIYCFTETENHDEIYKIPPKILLIFKNFIIKRTRLSLMQIRKLDEEPYIVWGHKELEVENDKCGIEGSQTKVVFANKQIREKNNRILLGQKDGLQKKTKAILDVLEKFYV